MRSVSLILSDYPMLSPPHFQLLDFSSLLEASVSPVDSLGAARQSLQQVKESADAIEPFSLSFNRLEFHVSVLH